MIDIDTVVPDGILCLWSAWNIHQLTTSLPQAFHVAVKRNRKVTVPTFPKDGLCPTAESRPHPRTISASETMSKEEIKNYGKSIRTKLLNVAKKEDVFYQTVLTRWAEKTGVIGYVVRKDFGIFG